MVSDYNYKLISSNVMTLLGVYERARKLHNKEQRKKITNTIHSGKLCIGVEFAVRKLQGISAAEVASKPELAQVALAKISAKGIQMLSFLLKALTALSQKAGA